MLTAYDALVVGLRALAFVAVMQAAGSMIFLSLFGDALVNTGALLRKAFAVTAFVAIVLTVLHHFLEPARMAASFSGIWDISLQTLLLQSGAGTARAVRLLGLALVIAACLSGHPFRDRLGLIAAALLVASFLFMGHTATHDLRWLLSLLLLLHLLVAAFWFGVLMPFRVIATREHIAVNAVIIGQFSRIATWVVPIIFLAGVGIAFLMIPDRDALFSKYGAFLLVKLLGFAVLMGLAARNKLSYVPAISRGDMLALGQFRRLVKAEWLIIATVLGMTAIMTSLFSPS